MLIENFTMKEIKLANPLHTLINLSAIKWNNQYAFRCGGMLRRHHLLCSVLKPLSPNSECESNKAFSTNS